MKVFALEVEGASQFLVQTGARKHGRSVSKGFDGLVGAFNIVFARNEFQGWDGLRRVSLDLFAQRPLEALFWFDVALGFSTFSL